MNHASIPLRYVNNKKGMRRLLEEIYPGNRPATGWKCVGIDSESYKNEETGREEFTYFQISNGKVKVVIEGPCTSRVCGRDGLDLPKKLKHWLQNPKVKKWISTTRADYRPLRAVGYGKVRGIEGDTEICDWLFDENRLKHGLKEAASDHLQIFMRPYSQLFGWKVGSQKIVANMRQVVEGNEPQKLVLKKLNFKIEESKGLLEATNDRLKRLRLKWRTKRTPQQAAKINKIVAKQADYKLRVKAFEKEARKLEKFMIPWTGKEGRKRAVAYAGLDPYATVQLGRFYKKQLKKQDLWNWYREVERPLTMTLIRMEDRGIRINEKAVHQIRREVHGKVLRLEHVFRAVTDQPQLNLRSPLQVAKVLFDELGWPVIHRNDLSDKQEQDGQEEGNASLAAWVLQEYKKKGYELADVLLQHRTYSTMHNVFLTGALLKRNYDTNLIHTRFKQSRTVTGRLASGDREENLMNLQNIPSRKEKDPYRLRQFFLPTKAGYKLIVADYSQVELYIIAQISGDKRMIQAFKRGEDLHMLTAAKIYGLKLPREPKSWDPNHRDYKRWREACEEWKEKYDSERKNAKIVNFGLNYGMSAYKLANDNDMEESEAEEWIEGYFELYPGVWEYMQETIAFARKHGYVIVPTSGRRRRLPEINSQERGPAGHAERQAMNMGIQGGAADIIKVAMNSLELGARYRTRYLPSKACIYAQKCLDMGVEMLLQVHDELVLQAPEEFAEAAVPYINNVMVAPFSRHCENKRHRVFMDVDIKASIGVGPSWAAAKK